MSQASEKRMKRKRKFCGCCCLSKARTDIDENYLFEKATTYEKVPKTSDAVYKQDLDESLRPGSCIIIRGTARPVCKRFAINLVHVRSPTKSDVAFHLNPRLALRYVVRNSCINNSWGDEETTSVEKFHLSRNKTFEIQIVASEREFLVALDGRHLCAYVYRIPLEKINQIQVDGAIDVESVKINTVNAYPTITAESTLFEVPFGSGLEESHDKDQKLIVPITAELPQGFKIGWQLEIIGRVKILPSAFYINLQEGNTLWPHPMIPLHLNPRFYTSYGNHLFVRNSWMGGEWGAEERTPGFQFTPGKNFHLAIRKNLDNFGVWVDGKLAGEFLFRTPVDTIDTVYIHGDVQIKSIYMKDHIDDKYFNKSREKINNL